MRTTARLITSSGSLPAISSFITAGPASRAMQASLRRRCFSYRPRWSSTFHARAPFHHHFKSIMNRLAQGCPIAQPRCREFKGEISNGARRPRCNGRRLGAHQDRGRRQRIPADVARQSRAAALRGQFVGGGRRLRVDSDSSLASNAAVGRSTLRAGRCHLLDDWRASSFRVNRPSAPETLTGRFRQLLSFARPNSNVGSQSEAVVVSGISTDSSWPVA